MSSDDNNNNDHLLTADTVSSYLFAEHKNDLPIDFVGDADSASKWKASAIMGGNVNYAFVVENTANNKKVFVKQAPEFVAIFGPDGFPLSSERMEKEINVYAEWNTMLTSNSETFLPEIYFFDKSKMTVCMEFLDGYELLDHVLVSSKDGVFPMPTSWSDGLGKFMGTVHAATHSSNIGKEKVLSYAQEYENRPMRDIQLEFVFTKAYKESTDEQRAGLELTAEFLEQVELLKSQYNYVPTTGETDASLVLCHGDLHPGSVMVVADEKSAGNDVKVIDPEFTVYGPPGLDVGSLLSGYILGAIHQAYSKNAAAAENIIDAIQRIWESYVAAFGGENADLVKSIEIETVGFAVAEVCRTALGHAGGRVWLQFPDAPETQKAAQKTALNLVQNCLVPRHDAESAILLLQQQLRKACMLEAKWTNEGVAC